MDLLGRQELDNLHGPLATRASPNRGFSSERRLCWRRSRQQSSAEGQQHTATPIRQQPEVPDTREAPWQNVFEKAPQELLVSQRHRSLLTVMCVVFPAESHVGVCEINEAMIGDCDTVSVAG